jgi:hypothetical protein
MSTSIRKRTAVAFAYADTFAYAQPYCTKNFIFFAQISMSIGNNKLSLIAKKFGLSSLVLVIRVLLFLFAQWARLS